MRSKLYIFTNYPTREKPTSHTFIKHRVEVLKNDYDLTVISVNIGSESNESISSYKCDGYQHTVINIKRVRIPKLQILFYERKIYKLLKGVLGHNIPDLIEVHFSSYYSWIIRKLCLEFSVPYIITEHASFFEKKIKQRYIGRKIKKAINDADKILAVSEFLKSNMENYIEKDIEVIPNIVDIADFQISPRKHDNELPKMITVGRFNKRDTKGYELLIKSLNLVQKKGYDFNCDIIGEGPQLNYFQELLNKYHLSARVKLLGSIPNKKLEKFYNASDFYISASKKETFGVAIVEAMSCGLPIVSTKSGGPESIVSKEAGLLCEYNVPDLARKIGEMIETYKKYEPLTIRYRVEKYYSTNVYRSKMKEIYSQILE